MTTKSLCEGIPVRNIYHMLCYAWNAQYLMDECPAGDDGAFDGVRDLLSFLIVRESLRIAEGGLAREYRSRQERLQLPRGRIDMARSFALAAQNKVELACEIDKYTAENALNGIIAFSLNSISDYYAVLLDKEGDARFKKTRRMLAGALDGFKNVSPVEPTPDLMGRLSFNVLTSRYRFVLSLCAFLHEESLPLHGGEGGFMGEASLSALAGIFERFVREFYRAKLPQLYGPEVSVEPGHRVIKWQVEENAAVHRLMPRMEADVWIEREMPRCSPHVIIMDAKCYREALQGRKVRPPHLYQLCSYMANARMRDGEEFGYTTGCLIYPLTGGSLKEDISLLAGRLHVRTVDLSASWQDVERQMLEIYESMLPDAIELATLNQAE